MKQFYYKAIGNIILDNKLQNETYENNFRIVAKTEEEAEKILRYQFSCLAKEKYPHNFLAIAFINMFLLKKAEL